MSIFSDLSISEPNKKTDICQFKNETRSTGFCFSADYIIIYCEGGTAMISTISRTLILKNGDCILIPPYLLHKINFENFCGTGFIFKKSYIYTNYSVTFATELLSDFEDRIFLMENCQKGISLIAKITAEPDLPASKYKFITLARLLLSFKSNKIQNKNKSFAVIYSKTVLKIVDYINQNLSKQLSISNISEQIGFSQAHISRTFKKELALSPTEFISMLKIIEASKLLSNTNLNIKEICEQCGFASNTYFQSLFKKFAGITPKEYRNVNQTATNVENRL